MMPPKSIQIELLSDSTFGSGYGIAGGIDTCVAIDEWGLPILSGKTLHGLFKDSWLTMAKAFPQLDGNASRILGYEADLNRHSILRIGNASVNEDVKAWVRYALQRKLNPLSIKEITESLSSQRTQTAISRASGAQEEGSLRITQVVLRGITLISSLNWLDEPTQNDLKVLAMILLSTRHAGLMRTRGRGHVRLTFDGDLSRTLMAADLEGRRP